MQVILKESRIVPLCGDMVHVRLSKLLVVAGGDVSLVASMVVAIAVVVFGTIVVALGVPGDFVAGPAVAAVVTSVTLGFLVVGVSVDVFMVYSL